MSDSFQTRLRDQRELRGYTQKELAKRSGISGVCISKLETGDRKPNVDYLWRLSKALEVTADYLLGSAPPEKAVEERKAEKAPPPPQMSTRERFAIAFATAHIESGEAERAVDVATFAVRHADALVKELAK